MQNQAQGLQQNQRFDIQHLMANLDSPLIPLKDKTTHSFALALTVASFKVLIPDDYLEVWADLTTPNAADHRKTSVTEPKPVDTTKAIPSCQTPITPIPQAIETPDALYAEDTAAMATANEKAIDFKAPPARDPKQKHPLPGAPL